MSDLLSVLEILSMNFQILDWIILLLYLGASLFIGIRARRYVENMEGYFVAGRRVKVALGSATLIATEIGVVTFMYFGELGYVTGLSCFVLGLIGFLGYFVIGKTGFIVSGLRRLRVITIPEFYELRYGRNVRLLGGILLFLGGVLNMGVFLKMDGIFLTETMGFSPDILYIVMTVMLLIVISYTVFGGMFSVIITDFMQFVILTFGMFIATIFVLMRVNIGEIATTVGKQFGEAGVNPIVNPRFGWMFLIWMLIGSVAISALNQPAVSKSFASESPVVARKVFLYTGITLAGRYMIPMFWGVAALAVFGPTLNPTTAMPKLLGEVVPSGLLGLMIAGMLAASMSTYSAYLLAWSSVATRDIIAPLSRRELSERTTILLSRIISTLIGIFILIFGLYYQLPATAFQYIAITGAMYAAGAFGCVAFGLYWKRANIVGAYCSLAFGAVAPIAFLILDQFKSSLPDSISFLVDVNISGFLSFLLAASGMILGSLVSQRTHPPIALEAKNRDGATR
jgi:SSS family solute:Na+ symporter